MLNAMREWEPRGASRGAVVRTALAMALLLLASCAGKIPPTIAVPAPEPRIEEPLQETPSAKLEAGDAVYQDQYRLSLPLAFTIQNPRAGKFRLESADCVLSVQGEATPLKASLAKAQAGDSSTDAVVEGGSEFAIAYDFPVDVRELDASVSGPRGPKRASFSGEARARLVDENGRPFDASARVQGSFLIVRDPLFRITSLKIERDILVTTNLALELDVENPNDFPLEFDAMDYRFYGEGKSWAMGSYKGAVALPPESTKRVKLAFEMNFADRDRKLFDLVAELKTVNYGLRGRAKVATGLPFLPEFSAEVDEEGSCQVER
jgi:LEA14-like dessication related protein